MGETVREKQELSIDRYNWLGTWDLCIYIDINGKYQTGAIHFDGYIMIYLPLIHNIDLSYQAVATPEAVLSSGFWG